MRIACARRNRKEQSATPDEYIAPVCYRNSLFLLAQNPGNELAASFIQQPTPQTSEPPMKKPFALNSLKLLDLSKLATVQGGATATCTSPMCTR